MIQAKSQIITYQRYPQLRILHLVPSPLIFNAIVSFANETKGKILKKEDKTNLLLISQPSKDSSSFKRML